MIICYIAELYFYVIIIMYYNWHSNLMSELRREGTNQLYSCPIEELNFFVLYLVRLTGMLIRNTINRIPFAF